MLGVTLHGSALSRAIRRWKRAEAFLAAVARRGRWNPAMLALASSALLSVGGPFDVAKAQTCTVAASSVTLGSGSCSIAANTTLNGSPAVHATTGAQISTNNVTINPFNGGSTGALAETAGVITFNSGSSINGNWSTAASAQGGGRIVFQPGSAINPPFGGGGTALLANGVGSQIVATGLTVKFPTGGGANTGARATNGGAITLNGGTTINYGQFSGGNIGLWATGPGSTIVTDNVTVMVPSGGGGSNTGVRVDGGAGVTLANTAVVINTSGGSDIGLLATGAGSNISASNVAVTIAGGSSGTGVQADTGGNVTLNGGAVSVSGNGGNETGLLANGAASSIVGAGVVVNVSSINGDARGGTLQNGATINLTGGSVTTSGNAQSYGFLFQAPTGVTNTLGLSGTTVSAAADAFAVQGGTAAITTDGATVTGNPYSGNSGILLSATNGSTVTLASSGSTLTGAITTGGGSTSGVTLGNGTVWNMTASSNATNLANNDSEINVIAPTATNSYKTLTVANYTGTGGSIVLNTYLGADSSPSDQLVINGGTASGATTLVIHNTTGPGDQTTANGILVVNAINGATTAANAFALPGELRAGAYDYRLFRGGINGNDPQDWFLRSTFLSPPSPPQPTPLPEPVEPPGVLPPDPPPTTPPLSPGLYPIIGPEIATYGVVQPIARQLGVASFGTLNDRIGDTLADVACGTGAAGDTVNRVSSRWPGDCKPDAWWPSIWGRTFGESFSSEYRAFADSRASGSLAGFQAGFDVWRGSLISGHRDVAGFYAAYASASADVTGLVTNAAATGYVLQHTGSVNLDGLSGGAYWTHVGPGGWYLDAVAQVTRYDAGASTPYTHLGATGTGMITSLENGYPFALPLLGPGFVLEPQVQILWQGIHFDGSGDEFGAVSLGTTSGVSGRIGLRARWTVTTSDGLQWQPYLRANLWRDWGGAATVTYAGSDLVPLMEESRRLQLGGGLTARLDTHFNFYVNADYQFALDNLDGGKRDGVRGAAGIRYVW